MTFTQPTLQDIRDKVRRVTARYQESQLTTSQIDRYINNFYLYELPENFRTLKLLVPYVFTSIPNQDTYNFPFNNFEDNVEVQGYVSLKPPVYCAGYELRYYQDKNEFYNNWPKRSELSIINFGTGASTYTGTIPYTPMLRGQIDVNGTLIQSNVIISAQMSGFTLVANDTPVPGSDIGNLVGPQIAAGSTINYLTGAYVLNTLVPIPPNVNIDAQVIPYSPSRPTDVLFYNNQIVFRPVPINVFQIEFQAYKTPTSLMANGSPELIDWWQFLAYGSSKNIFADFPDPEGLAQCMIHFQEQMQLIQRRTLVQLSTQRAHTIFSTTGRRNYVGYIGGQGSF